MTKLHEDQIEKLANTIADQILEYGDSEQACATLFRSLGKALGLGHHLRPACIAPIFSRPELPRKAPQTYRRRAYRKETPIEFLHRVYGPWIGNGMTHNHLLNIDPPLYWGLRHYCRYHLGSNRVSESVGLPTKQQLIDEDHAIVIANFSDKAAREALDKEIIALRRVHHFLKSRGNEAADQG